MQISKKFIMEDKDGNNLYPASFTDIVFRADGIKLEDELDRIDSKDVEQDNKLSQHERRLAEVEGKGGSSNVLLEEEEQDKFNFVKNKVVQDGLVYTDKTTYTSATKLTLNKSKQAYEITFKCRLNLIDSSLTQQWFISESDGAFRVGIKSNGLLYIQRVATEATGTTTLKVDVEYIVTLRLFGNKVSCFLNGKEECSIDYDNCESTIGSLWVLGFWDGSKGAKAIINGLQIYTRPLALAEIQHNLSVLNNSPSIKELHATDSTGKTSILNLASSEDFVEMSTGRTLREEYMGVLKTMGKEFTSADGSPIQVPNGIEARVVNAEINGQTVKNYAPAWVDGFTTSYKKNKDRITISEYDGQVASSGEWIKQLKPNKNYTVFINVLENTCTRENIFMNSEAAGALNTALVKIGAKQTGWLSFDFTTKETFDKWVWTVRASSGETLVAENPVIVERADKNKVIKYIPFGLSSTEAIISNNGQQYPIYEPTIQGKTRILDTDTGLVPTDPLLPPLKDGDVLDLATKTITFANKSTQVLTDEQVEAYSKYKKVISLGGVGDAKDTLEILEDGSVLVAVNFDKLLITSESNIACEYTPMSDVDKFIVYVTSPPNQKQRGVGISSMLDVYNVAMWGGTYTNYGIFLDGTNNVIRIVQKSSEYGLNVSSTKDDVINAFKQRLLNNPITLMYQTVTPIITHIPKELVPAILTHNQTNILEAGGAVKPSNYKITLPVNKLSDFENRLQALEGTMINVVLNKN